MTGFVLRAEGVVTYVERKETRLSTENFPSNYTLKRNSTTSPSFITYSLPSE